MFYDLNIKRLDSSPSEMRSIINEAHRRGYNAVAITTEWAEEAAQISGNKRKRKAAEGPLQPVDVKQFSDIPIKIYNRINILVKDTDTFIKLNRRDLKFYDVISYCPGNAAVLKALTSFTDFDLLSFDPAMETEPLHFNRKLYKQFVQNGVYMEIPYYPSILDSTYRKYTIFTAHVYHAIGKSENIIVTSGASQCHSLRSPYDIINLYPFVFNWENDLVDFPIKK